LAYLQRQMAPAAFTVGAAMPVLTAVVAPQTHLIAFVAGASLVFLALLGAVAARAGGANVIIGAMRVLFWGALAMALTAGVGALFGTPA
jgi:VIT1/CCC1 family predicted Fe2+/Mn2+ transporter